LIFYFYVEPTTMCFSVTFCPSARAGSNPLFLFFNFSAVVIMQQCYPNFFSSKLPSLVQVHCSESLNSFFFFFFVLKLKTSFFVQISFVMGHRILDTYEDVLSCHRCLIFCSLKINSLALTNDFLSL
jgi:hypothetical protein